VIELQERNAVSIAPKASDKQKRGCSVTITCGHPSEEGKMDVEFTYDGDKVLVMYLLETAQDFMHEQITVND
jgi:hypothetical protein